MSLSIKRFRQDIENYYENHDYEGAKKFLEEKEIELKYEVAPEFGCEK